MAGRPKTNAIIRYIAKRSRRIRWDGPPDDFAWVWREEANGRRLTSIAREIQERLGYCDRSTLCNVLRADDERWRKHEAAKREGSEARRETLEERAETVRADVAEIGKTRLQLEVARFNAPADDPEHYGPKAAQTSVNVLSAGALHLLSITNADGAVSKARDAFEQAHPGVLTTRRPALPAPAVETVDRAELARRRAEIDAQIAALEADEPEDAA